MNAWRTIEGYASCNKKELWTVTKQSMAQKGRPLQHPPQITTVKKLVSKQCDSYGTVNSIGFPQDLKKPRDVRQRGQFTTTSTSPH
ncbi:hypothetical protein MAR_019963 [Mya arenaria]|uniref:Uncharacterized protein n=1 Tax=Mya arenaria TaxID=6604 RepID=A0ABY7E873_MYAAR|nr:hypothetical protein MAR_019963 [Mya arenaria]